MSLNKRSAYLEKELITKYGDMLNANVPGIPELKMAHGLSHEVATKLNRSLRYKVEKARELRCAEKLLNAEAKRLRVPIAELVDVPVVPLDDKRLKHITKGVKVSSLNISKHMASLMTRAKGAVGPKQYNAQLEQLIRSQCWPNIFIQTCPGHKGEECFRAFCPSVKELLCAITTVLIAANRRAKR